MKLFQKLFRYKYYLSIILIGFIYFNQIFININMILSSIDILYVFSPNKLFLTETIKNLHEIPLWSNLLFSGSPFLANPTSGIFYPLNYLFFLSKPEFIFGYLFTIDIILIGIFTFIYSRVIRLSEFASLVSAITFMLSSPVVTRIYPGHLFIVDAIVWFPLTLYFFEKIILTKKLIYGLAASVSITLMFFAGHTQITFYSLFILFAYFLLRVLFEYKDSRIKKDLIKYFQLFLFSILIFIGLSSVQLIPTLEFSRFLTRVEGISLDFASKYSLHPYQLISFILPNFYGNNLNNTFWGIGNIWETSGYIGIISLIFALIGVIYKKNKYIFIFLFFAVFTILFSFGKYFFFFSIFFNHFPFMNYFRAPSRMLFIYAFSVSILAGFGFDYLLRTKSKLKSLKFINLLILSFIILQVALIFYLLNTNGLNLYERYILKNSYAIGINHKLLYSQLLKDFILLATYLLLYLVITYLFLSKRINKFTFSILILLIILGNLYLYGNKLIIMGSPEKIYSNPNIVNIIKKDNDKFRVFDIASDYIVYSAKNNLEYVTGIEAGIIKDYRDLILLAGKYENTPFESLFLFKNIDDEAVLNLFNTKYIVSDKNLDLTDYELITKDKYELFNQNKTVVLYKNNNLLPRAYVVPNALVTKNKVETLNLIKENMIDFKKTVLLEENPEINTANSSDFKKADISYYSPNRIDLTVDIKDAGFLVLSEIWYPGWKAADNGKEIKILKANYLFRSIPLEKGSHKITFFYDPLSFKIGALISLSTLLLILTITTFLFRNNKNITFFHK